MSRVPISRFPAVRQMVSIVATVAFLTIALLAIFAPVAKAAPAVPHFGPSVLVAQVPSFTIPNPSVAVGSDGVVYAAYAGWGGATQSDIYFTKSSDGRTWTAPLRVNKDGGAATQADPSIALDARSNISIVWTDNRNGNNDIFFSRSTDGGLSFTPDVRANDVTTNAQTDGHVGVDPVNPGLIHVVWMDGRNGNNDIYYANSTDGGLSFNPSARVNNDAGAAEQSQSAIAVAPNRDVYVVWRDLRTPGRGYDVFFSKSSDRGATWTPSNALNTDATAANQIEPVIAVDGAGTIYVAWTDSRNAITAPDIYATRSTNAGLSFTAEGKVNNDAGSASQTGPTLAANGGKVVASWTDTRTTGSTGWDVYASSSIDGLTWSTNMKVNDESLASTQLASSLGVDSSGDVFAAWVDTRGSGLDVYAGVLDVVAPVSSPGAARSGDQGATISFNGSASQDNLGIASYSWDFGDGTTGTGSVGGHAYANAGAYTAALTVWDYSGNSASSTTTVTIRDTKAPLALGSGDRSVDEGQPLFFDASASTDNVGVVEYDWNFGDGSSANTPTANHAFAHSGTYDATLTVKDAAGNSGTAAFKVTVRPNGLLGIVQILAGIVAILTIAVILLAWMALGKRKREDQQGRTPPSGSELQPPPPPRDSDPFDMTFPPAPPKGP